MYKPSAKTDKYRLWYVIIEPTLIACFNHRSTMIFAIIVNCCQPLSLIPQIKQVWMLISHLLTNKQIFSIRIMNNNFSRKKRKYLIFWEIEKKNAPRLVLFPYNGNFDWFPLFLDKRFKSIFFNLLLWAMFWVKTYYQNLWLYSDKQMEIF